MISIPEQRSPKGKKIRGTLRFKKFQAQLGAWLICFRNPHGLGLNKNLRTLDVVLGGSEKQNITARLESKKKKKAYPRNGHSASALA